jgi:hypothetical protein
LLLSKALGAVMHDPRSRMKCRGSFSVPLSVLVCIPSDRFEICMFVAGEQDTISMARQCFRKNASGHNGGRRRALAGPQAGRRSASGHPLTGRYHVSLSIGVLALVVSPIGGRPPGASMCDCVCGIHPGREFRTRQGGQGGRTEPPPPPPPPPPPGAKLIRHNFMNGSRRKRRESSRMWRAGGRLSLIKFGYGPYVASSIQRGASTTTTAMGFERPRRAGAEHSLLAAAGLAPGEAPAPPPELEL